MASHRLGVRLLTLVCLCIGSAAMAMAQGGVIHTFAGAPSDGALPLAGLVTDGVGNLYGTTAQGGNGQCMVAGSVVGCGTAFELSFSSRGSTWTETILYNFQNGADGGTPSGALVRGLVGNFYGTTQSGGAYGQGTVFELSPNSGGGWTQSVVYSFKGGADGAIPRGNLIIDGKGNLYGTTEAGGGSSACAGGCGTVFELSTSSGTETLLHAFTSGPDGAYPYAGLEKDAGGNLYGTTAEGGILKAPEKCTATFGGCGTVFELRFANGVWTEHILHRFQFTDGSKPLSTPAYYKGVLYGTTSEGNNYGSVFQLTNSGGKATLTSIFGFDQNNGSFPQSGVVIDQLGNLFGVTNGGPANGLWGNVYELSPPTGSHNTWTQTILYSFPSAADGGPVGGVLIGGDIIYGTTSGCEDGACSGSYGTVFAVVE